MISGGITPPIMKELPLTEKGAMLTEVVIIEPTALQGIIVAIRHRTQITEGLGT